MIRFFERMGNQMKTGSTIFRVWSMKLTKIVPLLFIFLLFSTFLYGENRKMLKFGQDESSENLLHTTFIDERFEKNNFLLAESIHINMKNEDGWAPLYYEEQYGLYLSPYTMKKIKWSTVNVIIPLSYISFSVYLRENKYKDDPLYSDWSRTNAIIGGGILGGVVGYFVGQGLSDLFFGRSHHTGPAVAREVLSNFCAGLFCLIGAGIADSNRDVFEEDSSLYYGSTVLAASIPIVVYRIDF